MNSYIWKPHRPRVFFLHIPKTAGTMLRVFFENQYNTSEIFRADDWVGTLNYDVSKIDIFRLFRGHFTRGFIEFLPPRTRLITYLREPISRTLSHLKHLRRDPNFHPAYELAKGRSLDELVRDEAVMALCTDVQTSLLSNDVPGETILQGLQRDWDQAVAPNSDVYAVKADLSKAREALAGFDFVGTVETLHEDIMQMSLMFGFHPPDIIARRNEDPAIEQESVLDSGTLKILKEKNALDLDLYHAVTTSRTISRRKVVSSLVERCSYAPISRPTEFPLSGPIPGANWYEAEHHASGTYRWTGPLRETTLDLPIRQGYRAQISLRLGGIAIDDFSISANNSNIEFETVPDKDRHRISFWIAPEHAQSDGFTTIVFKTTKLINPTEFEMRTFSFMVSELRVAAIEKTDLSIEPGADKRPTLDKLHAGCLLADRDLDQIHLLGTAYDDARGKLDQATRLAGELRVRLQSLQNYMQEMMASIRAPILGYAHQVGSSSGMFHDGWAGREVTFEMHLHRRVTELTLCGFIPPHFPVRKREFTIDIGEESFSFVMEGGNGVFRFDCLIDIAADADVRVTLRCDSNYNAYAFGTGGDRRDLSYRLIAIELAHEASFDARHAVLSAGRAAEK
ncbi:MAG: sulfotransferase family 2 domain-containing protein [Alphaproteobacteria bacterium]|nr:sulfotransferase family 2 domain-containing protein [Alphaproteobacteria bacterium]